METLRYVRSSLDLTLVFSGSDNYDLVGYADADWAADLETAKSMWGYVFFMGGVPISWKSKKSKTLTATSSTMSEIEGLYNTAIEGEFLIDLMISLGLVKNRKFTVYQDNKAAIAVVNGEKFLDRTKSLVTKVAYLRDLVQQEVMEVKYIETGQMTADIFTKSLGKNLFEKHVKSLCLENKKTEDMQDEGEC